MVKGMNRRMKMGRRLPALLLAVLLLLTGIFTGFVPAKAASGLGTVTLTIERFTLGQGYLAEPMLVEIQEGDDYSKLLTRVMDSLGIRYTYTGNVGWSFYLSGIKDADTGNLNIPLCIRNMPPQRDWNGQKVYPPNNSAVNDYAPDLQEYSYNSMSGWMYSVNNEFPDVGMDGKVPQNGDVFRVQFTVFGYGLDLEGSDATYQVADKSLLTAKIAQINQNKEAWFSIEGCKENYNRALEILQTVDASQESVNEIYAALPERAPVYPESISLDQTELELYVGNTASLSADIQPEDADDKTLQWSTSTPSVAQVSEAGTVTAVGPGEATVTAMTSNGLTASCHVAVQHRKIEEITLSRSSASMEAEQTLQLSVASYKPENATEELQVSWESSNQKVASVDTQGMVTAHAKGEAVIRAVTSGGISAQCRITVGSAKEVAEALEKKIQELPDSASGVTWENASQIADVYKEYEGMSEAAKGYLSESSKKKLVNIYAVAEKILGQQEKVQQVTAAIRALPALSEVTLDDAGQINQAKEQYDSLSTAEKGRIATKDLQRLNSVLKRLEELQQEVQEIEEAVQAIPEGFALDAAEEVLQVQKLYNGLTESQQASLPEETGKHLERAVLRVRDLVSQAIWAVPQDKLPDLDAQLMQDFLKADSLYGNMDGEIQESMPEGTNEKRRETEARIAEVIHSAGAVTVDNYWFAKTAYETMEDDAEILKKINRAEGAASAKTLIHGKVTYTDIRTGDAYQLEKPVKFYLQVPEDWESISLAVLYRIDGNSVDKIDYTYEKETGRLVFSSADVGEFLLARLTIPASDISLASSQKVGKGETVTLNAKVVPANYTEDKAMVWKSMDETIATVDQEGTVTGVSEGTTKIRVSLKSDSSIQAECKVKVTSKANPLSKSVKTALKEASDYMLSVDTNPTKGSEWFVIGLARYGMDPDSSYFTTYYNHIANYLKEKDGNLGARYTEYSKLILALTAIGKDARDIAGYNLFTYLADFEKVSSQGINGPIWALIALNSNPAYEIPTVKGVSVQTTEQLLLETVLKAELPGGGWSLSGEQADSDMSGMALQALAPYYQKEGYDNVTAAVNRGLEKLSDMQLSTGGYGTMGAETSESNAQVITALSSLGIDAGTDTRFIKNGRWTVENLLSYQVGNTGFMHVKKGASNNGGGEGGKVNGMATEQAFYALVAYQRLLDGKTSLYDMSDLSPEAGGEGDGSGTGLENSGSSTGGSGMSHGSSLGQGSNSGSTPSLGTSTSSGKRVSLTKGTEKTKSGAGTSDTEKKSGWSFTGDTYRGRSEAASDTEGGAKAGNTDKKGQNIEREALAGGDVTQFLPYIGVIAGAVVVIVICIVLKRKRA